jgi:hypothetical protein
MPAACWSLMGQWPCVPQILPAYSCTTRGSSLKPPHTTCLYCAGTCTLHIITRKEGQPAHTPELQRVGISGVPLFEKQHQSAAVQRQHTRAQQTPKPLPGACGWLCCVGMQHMRPSWLPQLVLVCPLKPCAHSHKAETNPAASQGWLQRTHTAV